MAGRNEGDLQKDASQGSIDRVIHPWGGTLLWNGLLQQTYALYADRFKTFFLVALPPAIVAYLCRFIQRVLVEAIRANGWMPPRSSPGYWVVFTVVALLEGAAYWVISALLFAAIASHVLRETEGQDPSVAGAFRKAGKRFRAVTAVALVIWAAFTVGRGIAGFALFTILDRLNLLGNRTVVTISSATVLLLLAGLLSRLGLAIPILMDSPDISVSQSLRHSCAKTKGWDSFFLMFLTKTAILGYGAYWLVDYGLARLYLRGMPREDTRVWLASVLYICLAAILESPLFIAFSLLYRDSKTKREEAVPAVVG